MKSELLNTPQTIDECIELAAEHLPSEWELVITIEKNIYSIMLVNPERENFAVDGGDGLRSDIIEGINNANGFKE
tara:strand:+ start:1586 stop:1810 length:225 start_codon:yes stop_codon:yes gene_type:complete